MTDSQQSIQQAANLLQFFRSELGSAFENLGLTITDETQTYLIHLLEGYIRLDEKKREDIGFERAAALMLGDALQSGGDRRIEAYRRLGDASLFSCGFFEQHLDRANSLVRIDYYRDMGRNAYSNLQTLMRFKAPGGAFHVIFDELTRKFDTVVEAFRSVAHQQQEPSCARLLERWQRGDSIDAKDWARFGAFPSSNGGDA